MRQAALDAIDAREFLKGAYWGFGEPATVWGIPKTSSWFVKDLGEIKRDPAKVKALLKEAGRYGAGSDHRRRRRIKKNQILQQPLTTAGIKTKGDYLKHARYVNIRGAGQFQVILSGAEPVVNPGDSYPFRFGCDEPKKGPKRILNYSASSTRNSTSSSGRPAQTTDSEKRYNLYSKVIRIIHQNLPEAPLVLHLVFYFQSECPRLRIWDERQLDHKHPRFVKNLGYEIAVTLAAR